MHLGLLVRRQRGPGVVTQQPGEAQHRVHRRAQLVRHARQEHRLRPAGTLGFVLGGQQRGLGALLRTDVGAEGVTQHLAGGTVDTACQGDQQMHRRPGGRGRVLALEVLHLAIQRAGDAVHQPRRVGRAGHIGHAAADQGLRRGLQQLGEPCIHIGVAQADVDAGDVAWEGRQQRPLLGLGRAQAGLCTRLDGDVAEPPHPHRPAGLLRGHAAPQQHAAVTQRDAVFLQRAAGDDLGHPGRLTRRVGELRHRHVHHAGGGQAAGLVGRNAPHLQHAVVDEQQRLVGVDRAGGEDGVAGGVERHAQVVHAGRQAALGRHAGGDVGGDQRRTTPAGALVVEREHPGLPPAVAGAGQVQLGHHHLHLAIGQAALQRRVALGTGHAGLQFARAAAQHLVGAEAGRSGPCLVDQQVHAVLVDHADRVGDGVERKRMHLQPGFIGTAAGDVEHRAHHAHRAPGGVAGHVATGQHIQHRAIGPAHAVCAFIGAASLQGVLQAQFQRADIVGMDARAKGSVVGGQRARRMAPQAVVLVGPVQRARRRVPVEAAQLGDLLGEAQQLMAAGQCLQLRVLRLQAPGLVTGGAVHAPQLAGQPQRQRHRRQARQGRHPEAAGVGGSPRPGVPGQHGCSNRRSPCRQHRPGMCGSPQAASSVVNQVGRRQAGVGVGHPVARNEIEFIDYGVSPPGGRHAVCALVPALSRVRPAPAAGPARRRRASCHRRR